MKENTFLYSPMPICCGFEIIFCSVFHVHIIITCIFSVFILSHLICDFFIIFLRGFSSASDVVPLTEFPSMKVNLSLRRDNFNFTMEEMLIPTSAYSSTHCGHEHFLPVLQKSAAQMQIHTKS